MSARWSHMHVPLACLALLLGPSRAALRAQSIRQAADTPVSIGLERPLVEPHLAIDPRGAAHLLGATIVGDSAADLRSAAGRAKIHCASFASSDGGVSWRRHDFSLTDCFDPWVAILPDGDAVFVALGVDPRLPAQRDGLVVYHSSDRGETWDDQPVGLGDGQDHPTVVPDTSSAAHRGWLYVLSSHDARGADGRHRFTLFIARSRNGGRSFDPPITIQPNDLTNKAETAVVLSDGTLVVSFVDAARGDGHTLLVRRRGWVVRSTDGGRTFSLPLFVNEACGPPPGFSLSALVADASAGPRGNRLYFACNQPGGHDIAVGRSVDGGISWDDAVPVHTATADTSISRKLMAAAVSRDGVLGIAWTERHQGPTPGCFEVRFAASLDGGRTFLPSRLVSDETSCPDDRRNGPAGSDYYGLVTDDRGRFRLLWSDARHGLYQLRTAVLEVERSAVKTP